MRVFNVSSEAIAKQRFESLNPFDYDEDGQPYITKEMTPRQVSAKLDELNAKVRKENTEAYRKAKERK